MRDFATGDYVIADHAMYDSFAGQTFRITGIGRNKLGQPLVSVENIASKGATSFYPHELSWEDGSRPDDAIPGGSKRVDCSRDCDVMGAHADCPVHGDTPDAIPTRIANPNPVRYSVTVTNWGLTEEEAIAVADAKNQAMGTGAYRYRPNATGDAWEVTLTLPRPSAHTD